MSDLIIYKVVPTKAEMQTVINNYLQSDAPVIEKYVNMKAIEQLAKIGIASIEQKAAIESLLEISGGAMTFDINGVKCQITKERITDTVKKYQFSPKVDKLRDNLAEAELKVKLLKDSIKATEVHEINKGIAVELQAELTGEPEPEKFGLKISIPAK